MNHDAVMPQCPLLFCLAHCSQPTFQGHPENEPTEKTAADSIAFNLLGLNWAIPTGEYRPITLLIAFFSVYFVNLSRDIVHK